MTMKKQRGFSLAELLVAIAITTIVLAATLGAFTDAVRINDFASMLADMDQNLRAAVNMMVRDISQTGTGIPTGGLPCPSGAGALMINRPSPPPAAFTFPQDPVTLATTVFAINPGDGLGPILNNAAASDIVTVLYADNTLPLNQTPLSAIAADGSTMTVDPGTPISAGLNTDIQPGDLIMFSNALGNAIQTVTRTTGTQTVFFQNGDFFAFNQRTVPSGSIMCLQNTGTNPAPGNCAGNNGGWPPTTATRVWMITYYLDDVTNAQLPRLVRVINSGTTATHTARPVALVLDNVQISYDLVDGVTNPANLPTIPTGAFPGTSPNQARKVNLFLAGRSTVRYSRTGQFLRNNVSTQISLRSLSFVSRY
jgi:prepilin-type N-terminal cleavage/methylation domain-containing protein